MYGLHTVYTQSAHSLHTERCQDAQRNRQTHTHSRHTAIHRCGHRCIDTAKLRNAKKKKKNLPISRKEI